MIKLTHVTLEPSEKKVVEVKSVWIGGNHIISMRREVLLAWDGAEFTNILLPGNISIDVKETPEEIMAMPEMLNASYPAMMVPAGPLSENVA